MRRAHPIRLYSVCALMASASAACLSADFAENLQCTETMGCPPEQSCDPNSFVCVDAPEPIEPAVPQAFINTTQGDCETDEGAHYPLGTEVFFCIKHLPRDRTLALGAAGDANELCDDLTFEHLRPEWLWEDERQVWLSSILVDLVPAGTQVTLCWRNSITELHVGRQLVWTDAE